MTNLSNFMYNLRRLVGFIPLASRFVFMNEDEIYNHLIKSGATDFIKKLRPHERKLLHFNLGMDIRNAYLLWHPKNPHTMKKISKLDPDQQASSRYHPDNFSWAIISRLIVASDVTKAS